MTVLLSWQGTIVCRHRGDGSLVQRPVNDRFDDADPVDIGMPAAALSASFADHLRNDTSLACEVATGALQGWNITRAADSRSLNLSMNGGYLCAVHASNDIRQAPHAQDWEGFLPLGEEDFAVLRQIVAGAWLIRSTGEHALAGSVRIGMFFELVIASMVIDMRWQLPFDLSAWPNRLTLLKDGWRIEQICRCRPLVYFAAFGSPAIMRQFALSVRSLRTHGGYQGDIAVLTDHSEDAIARLLAPFDGPRCMVIQRDAMDRMAYMAARYTIIDWPEASAYQPLLYVDTDIIFDAAIEPALHAIARSDQMSAPVEPLSPMRTSAAAGAGLLQLDGADPGYYHGFNSGTIGIPNTASHARTMALIGRIIANNATLKGRDSLPYADQEVANYVSYRIGYFDTALLAPNVRVGGEGPVSLQSRRGMVHFWAVAGSDHRADLMAAYLEQLDRLG